MYNIKECPIQFTASGGGADSQCSHILCKFTFIHVIGLIRSDIKGRRSQHSTWDADPSRTVLSLPQRWCPARSTG